MDENDTPDIDPLLSALSDGDSRAIIRELTEPMTAGELSEACDIPSSTVYKKLDILCEVSLLHERTDIRPDGHHTTYYEVAFDTIHLELDENHAFEIRADRPERTANERLTEMWSEIRKER